MNILTLASVAYKRHGIRFVEVGWAKRKEGEGGGGGDRGGVDIVIKEKLASDSSNDNFLELQDEEEKVADLVDEDAKEEDVEGVVGGGGVEVEVEAEVVEVEVEEGVEGRERKVVRAKAFILRPDK